MSFENPQGAFPASLTPAPTKTLFDKNYLNIADDDFNFAKQFLPEVYEKEVERYGNRSVSSFLRMVGAEMPMASDEVVWTEQGRLHVAYDDVKVADANTVTDHTLNITGHAIRQGQTIIVSKGLVSVRAYVQSVSTDSIEAYPLTQADWPASFVATTNPDLSVFVYGSEFAKGTAGMQGSIDAGFQKFSNSPIIMKDRYSINGSDTAQIGWVEVTSELGTSGYLWYLKSEHETRLRFEDYLEMTMVEAQKATQAINILDTDGSTDTGHDVRGTEGLFAAIEDRGLQFNDHDFNHATGLTGLADFDVILQELDKQGAIEENMMFLDRGTALAIDNMLARANSYGTGGTSYGVFSNNEDMALNLGFSGFRRGSYDFYKTDWKYLNDAATRGLTGDIDGVLVPAGVSTVYDQTLGKNIQRPFLHVRYRASEADDRRMKSWITGSVGGNYTSDIDEMNVHMLSERCLCVQGANNFILFKDNA
tara:strand:+ start:8813 stop:10246 length:1434 start_codon:yes stop_codon:yes gene_type:complete